MSYKEYAACTLKEITYRIEGMRKRQEQANVLEETKNLEQWRQARLIAFCALQPRDMTYWDFLPLPGDPTEEDRQKHIDASNEAVHDKARKLLAAFKQRRNG